LLKYAENAQHAFSSEHGPTLQTTLPALEALHKVWSTWARSQKYSKFSDALDTGLQKISTYYNRTSTSDAYIIATV
ncbi:hypothetical protein V8E55_004595, partial [Tylopilus felleus]